MPRGVFEHKRITPVIRFWAKVNKASGLFYEGTECWLWTGSVNTGKGCGGYGSFWDGERMRGAHIWRWEQEHGLVPEGLELDHLCRRRSCVLHLEPVTPSENVRRGAAPATTAARQRGKTACPHRHAYTPENTYLQGATGAAV